MGNSSFLILRTSVCLSDLAAEKLICRDSNLEPFGLRVNALPTALICLMSLGFDSHYINCIIQTESPSMRKKDVGKGQCVMLKDYQERIETPD